MKIRRLFLGLDDPGDGRPWPSQTEVAAAAGSDAAADRPGRWGRPRAVDPRAGGHGPAGRPAARRSRPAGGVMALRELADALIARRGTALEEPGERRRLASALVRVAYEAEQAMAEPRLHLRRAGGAAAGRHARAGRVRRAAGAGGRRDSRTRTRCRRRSGSSSGSTRSPSPSSRPTARRRATSGSSAWPPRRASTRPSRPGRSSTRAAWRRVGRCSSAWGRCRGWRQGFDPERTIRERIAARYPEAEPLPDRPELDRLLGEVGLDVDLGRAVGRPTAGRPGGPR